MSRVRRFMPEPPIYRFRITLLGSAMPFEVEEAWREIEVASNQTMADLGHAIPYAFDFDNDHLWSFYLSGKNGDIETEYALLPQPGLHTDAMPKAAIKVMLRDAPIPRRKFLYVFDFGDEWRFSVKLLKRLDEITPGPAFPRVVASDGPSPEQYPYAEKWDDEDWDDEDEEDEETE